MRFRVLDYMTRITINEEPDILHCVVIYVGKSSHATDTGTHQIDGLKDYPTFLWHYQVIHLWKMRAEELLRLERPALLPLVGQTKMDHPEHIISEVVARLKAVPDPTYRNQLIDELLALMDKEQLQMTEQILEKEDVVFDSPYLRRIRKQAEEEAQAAAQKEWFAKGIEQGIEQGIEHRARTHPHVARGYPGGTLIALRPTFLHLSSDRCGTGHNHRLPDATLALQARLAGRYAGRVYARF